MTDIHFILYVLRDAGLAFLIAFGFGFLFNCPKRSLLAAGLLGALGHGIRFILLQLGMSLIGGTLIGALIIGFSGIWLSHKIHNPPIVFSMPACITMIPGLFAYRTMLGFIKIADPGQLKNDPDLLPDTMHNLVLAASLLFVLAIGTSVVVLVFRKKSAKEIRLSYRKKNLMRKDMLDDQPL